MEKEDLKYDDLLKKLMQHSELDVPPDDFVDKVMHQIQASPATATVNKPFFLYLKSASPYLLLGVFCLIIFLSSDFPFMNWFPGKEKLADLILPYFTSLFAGFKAVFATKYFSIALMIAVAGLLLVVVDHLFSRKAPQNHTV